MKIYTRTGDQGETGLFGGPRVRKDAARIEACGTVDELNSALGLVRAESLPEDIDALLRRVQHELLAVGAELGTPDPVTHATRTIGPEHVQALEAEIDHYEAGLQPLEGFVLPGGDRAGAALHLARAVCRRAERRLVTLTAGGGERVSSALLGYLNRLSDLLFVLARTAGARAIQ